MKTNVVVGLVAGLLGGFLAHYADVRSVHAQDGLLAVPTKEIRASRFVLVDDANKVEGVLTFDSSDRKMPNGSPAIKFFDSAGKEVFSVGGRGLQPLASH
jgi:hypothetical protein